MHIYIYIYEWYFDLWGSTPSIGTVLLSSKDVEQSKAPHQQKSNPGMDPDLQSLPASVQAHSRQQRPGGAHMGNALLREKTAASRGYAPFTRLHAVSPRRSAYRTAEATYLARTKSNA